VRDRRVGRGGHEAAETLEARRRGMPWGAERQPRLRACVAGLPRPIGSWRRPPVGRRRPRHGCQQRMRLIDGARRRRGHEVPEMASLPRAARLPDRATPGDRLAHCRRPSRTACGNRPHRPPRLVHAPLRHTRLPPYSVHIGRSAWVRMGHAGLFLSTDFGHRA
jgi:hypothetical protein